MLGGSAKNQMAYFQPFRLKTHSQAAAIRAEAGMVRTQAQTIRPATPHLTEENLVVLPTPTMAPVMVWVVETGMPREAEKSMEMAPAAWAQNPPAGFNLVIFWPMVLMILQPPDIVPNPMAA